ncbi:hypothetical protein SBA4_830022 [Candidatus Sulfopaludibacter sp. SbA4]|nr:hypothetical protein SBA4_830022 [Candidatus Sulfopaludibacter sp. SbA4]
MIDTRLFRKAMNYIAARKGEFTLFALFLPDDGLGSWRGWDLVVSAPWLKRDDLESRGEVIDLMAKSIGRRSFRQLSRVVVLRDDPTVRSLLVPPVEDEDRTLQNVELFGLQFEKVIILRAKRPERKKRAAKALQPVGAGSSRGRG